MFSRLQSTQKIPRRIFFVSARLNMAFRVKHIYPTTKNINKILSRTKNFARASEKTSSANH